MGDGVLHRVQLIEHSQDTEDLRDAGMEKEDLGPMMFTFYKVEVFVFLLYMPLRQSCYSD